MHIKVALIDEGITNQTDLNFVELHENQFSKKSSHGTVIANLLAAESSAKTKYQGLIPNMPLYGYSLSADEMDTSVLVEGIETAINWDVDIISISMGTNKENNDLKNAILNAVNHGIVIICSAGNDPYEANYPASYNIPGVISVGAIGNDYNILPYTNVNSQIDIYAPGENIASFNKDNVDIKGYTGTSVAVPFITMACIYIRAYATSLNPEEVEELLIQSSNGYLAKWRYEQMEIKILDMEQLMKALNI